MSNNGNEDDNDSMGSFQPHPNYVQIDKLEKVEKDPNNIDYNDIIETISRNDRYVVKILTMFNAYFI